jgi:hypothetical protein
MWRVKVQNMFLVLFIQCGMLKCAFPEFFIAKYRNLQH